VARLGSLEFLVKDRQSGAFRRRCKAKSFGQNSIAAYLAASRRIRKAGSGGL
jgi:hypothetical protein